MIWQLAPECLRDTDRSGTSYSILHLYFVVRWVSFDP